jgi:hypothetical protein
MLYEFGCLKDFSYFWFCSTKNIVHLADSAKYEDDSNKQT